MIGSSAALWAAQHRRTCTTALEEPATLTTGLLFAAGSVLAIVIVSWLFVRKLK